jgi:Rrf2 family protein
MRVSKSEEQGMRLVAILAGRACQMTLAELAAESGLPQTTVAKLLGRLRRAQVVQAVRGRRGGYELAGLPERLSISRVLRPLGLAVFRGRFCLENPKAGGPCPRSANCNIRPVWAQLEARIEGMLEGVTVADLLHTESQVRAHLAEVWPRTNGKGTTGGPAHGSADTQR